VAAGGRQRCARGVAGLDVLFVGNVQYELGQRVAAGDGLKLQLAVGELSMVASRPSRKCAHLTPADHAASFGVADPCGPLSPARETVARREVAAADIQNNRLDSSQAFRVVRIGPVEGFDGAGMQSIANASEECIDRSAEAAASQRSPAFSEGNACSFSSGLMNGVAEIDAVFTAEVISFSSLQIAADPGSLRTDALIPFRNRERSKRLSPSAEMTTRGTRDPHSQMKR
jgi:hypothetical protein